MASDWKNTVGIIAPHVLIIILLCLYIVGGAVVFQYLDEELGRKPVQEIVLFVFITISTIGYGNIAPTTREAQVFCIVYSAFGIPLTFLALANLGKFLAEGYWIIVGLVTKREDVQTTENERRLPVVVCLLFLFGYILFGGLLFHFGEAQLRLIDAVYFSFISFTTIGFGDFYVLGGSVGHTIFMIAYLALGIVIVSTFVSALSVYLHRIHYIGRNFTGAGEVDVWFGGQSMTVNELILLVADQFGVSPEELQKVLHDLDDLIDAVCEQTQTETPNPQPLTNGAPKLMVRRSSSSENDLLLDECTNPLTVVIDQDLKHHPSLLRQTSASTLIARKGDLPPLDFTSINAHTLPARTAEMFRAPPPSPFDFSKVNAQTLPANRAEMFRALGMVYNITHSPTTTPSPTRRTALY